MTKECLMAYRSNREEIKELRNKINNISEDDGMYVGDVIKDYSKGFPRPQAVVGVDWDKVTRMEQRYYARIHVLEKECEEIEEFIESIHDSQTRRLFRMRFIEGASQRKIGRALHIDQSRVSRKINEFLKDA